MAEERILVVDDEEDVLELCTRALSTEGYHTSGARNGREALEMAQKQGFDLLLTDIRMPGMSGLQLYQAMKQHNPELVGLVITGHGSMDEAIEALRLGLDDFLPKPFSLHDLKAAICRALNTKRLQRENERLQALIPLYELSRAFIVVTDLDALLSQVLQVAVREADASLGVLMLKNETTGEFDVCAVVTDRGTQSSSSKYKISDIITSQAMQSEQAVVWQAASSQGSFFASQSINAQLKNAVAVPLIVKGEKVGLLGLSRKRDETPFMSSRVELLSVLASQAAIAIQNARLFARIRRANEELKELDRLKSEFVSTVSHELRSPLHSISGYVQLLLSGKVEGKETQNECLEIVHRQTQHLSDMINDLLDVSQMESAHPTLLKAPVQMHTLTEGVMVELKPVADTSQITLVNSTTPDLPTVIGDVERLRQVVRNLIHNAIKFTPPNGHVTTVASISNEWLQVSVQDDGIGIPSEAIPHLFERFYQVDGSSTRRVGGTGLGLYICKQIIAAHGGDIWVESELGKGSTFSFRLPL